LSRPSAAILKTRGSKSSGSMFTAIRLARGGRLSAKKILTANQHGTDRRCDRRLHSLFASPSSAPHCGYEVTLEPLTRKPRNLVKRSGLFEQVASSRDDHELLFAAELWKDHPVQLDHLDIVAADDQQRGRSNAGQGWSSQIRPAASGDDGTYHVRAAWSRPRGRRPHRYLRRSSQSVSEAFL